MGLFLSIGQIEKGIIHIKSVNKNIQNFVTNYINTKIINDSFKSYLSILLSEKDENKFIPNESFIAPECFIVGLLNGYLSGDGIINDDSIEINSASIRLLEGIQMLCSRLSIFTSILDNKNSTYRLQHIEILTHIMM